MSSYTSKASIEMTIKIRILYHLLAHLSHESQHRLYSRMFLFWFLYICRHRLVKHLTLYLFKSSISVQIVLYFSNSFSSSIRKDTNLLFPSLTLNVLTYPLVLGIIKTNSLIVLSKYPIKCLELVFLLTNFEIYMIKINIPNFYRPFCSIKIFFCYFSVSESHHYYAMNKIL